MRSKIAEALAFELGNHIDDLTDDDGGDTGWLKHQNGETVGFMHDTVTTGHNNSFFVVMSDGNRIRVTCEEVGSEPAITTPPKPVGMTRAERIAFENRTDFPGWENL